jgi:hypothetical protein
MNNADIENPEIQKNVGCGTTEDGSAVCVLPQDSTSAGCGCNTTLSQTTNSDQVFDVSTIPVEQVLTIQQPRKTLWQRVRSGLMLGTACAAGCCAPLFLPLISSLLAGTPVAVVLSQYAGLVYGALALITAVSLALAWRWMKTNPRRGSARQSAASKL